MFASAAVFGLFLLVNGNAEKVEQSQSTLVNSRTNFNETALIEKDFALKNQSISQTSAQSQNPGGHDQNSGQNTNSSQNSTDGQSSDEKIEIFGIGGKPLSTFNFEDFQTSGINYNSQNNSPNDRKDITSSSSLPPRPLTITYEPGPYDKATPVIGGMPVSAFEFDYQSNKVGQNNASRLSQVSDASRWSQNQNTTPTLQLQVNLHNSSAANASNPYAGYITISRSPVYTLKVNDIRVFRPIIEKLLAEQTTSRSEGIEERVGTTETSVEEEQGNTVSSVDNQPEQLVDGRLPWQVSVFSKHEAPPARVCGGSLVSLTAVVSAAHCFWKEGAGLLPAAQFAVGAGEALPYRNNDYDSHRQHSDVSAIKVPPEYSGGSVGDIALVRLSGRLWAARELLPVCLSFDAALEARQLVPGDLGTTLGVGLRKERGRTVLEPLRVPYVAEECRALGQGARPGDYICAGFKEGARPALGKICSHDAGSGLAFYLGSARDRARGIAVPFLRGVTSRTRSCDAGARAAYTRVREHRALLEGAGECGGYYPQLGALLEEREGTQFVCNCY